MKIEDRNSLMQMLTQAQTSHQLIPAVPAHLHPSNLAEAYAIQNAIADTRLESAAGYKVGMGSAAGLRKTAAGEPLIGRIASHRRHASGATITIPKGASAVVEVEAALEIAADGLSISRGFLAFEIVASRLVSGAAQGWPVFVADDAGCHAVVTGDALAFAGYDIPDVQMLIDGEAAGQMAKGDDAIRPMETFASFMAIAARHDMPRKPGMIVMTGSLIIPVPVTQPVRIEARAGGATVSARIALGDR